MLYFPNSWKTYNIASKFKLLNIQNLCLLTKPRASNQYHGIAHIEKLLLCSFLFSIIISWICLLRSIKIYPITKNYDLNKVSTKTEILLNYWSQPLIASFFSRCVFEILPNLRIPNEMSCGGVCFLHLDRRPTSTQEKDIFKSHTIWRSPQKSLPVHHWRPLSARWRNDRER